MTNLNHAMFRQDLSKHLNAIKRTCRRWGIPELSTCLTLILRDPANHEMSLVLTDEENPQDAYRVATQIEQRGIPEANAPTERA
jgi:hypothetical protein